MPGYLSGGQCYPTKWEAIEVLASTAVPFPRTVDGVESICRMRAWGETGNDETAQLALVCEAPDPEGGTMLTHFTAVDFPAVPCPEVTTPEALAVVGITPADTGLAFTFGLTAVLTLWALGYAINAAKALIRKA